MTLSCAESTSRTVKSSTGAFQSPVTVEHCRHPPVFAVCCSALELLLEAVSVLCFRFGESHPFALFCDREADVEPVCVCICVCVCVCVYVCA